ncbi:MAG TPA: hypothetical protein VN788_17465 [Verrucomicrobiae bacterium]|nr:hypothetical protein [Verrucomicrobiae bacterium]
MPWTKDPFAPVKKQSIRANRLISGMLDNSRFAKQPGQDEWRKGGPCGVNDICIAYQACQSQLARATNDAKRCKGIVHVSGWGLSSNGNLKVIIFF